MQLGFVYRTIRQFNGCNSLPLPPALTSVHLSEPPPFADTRTGGDRLDICDAANDPEKHARRLYNQVRYLVRMPGAIRVLAVKLMG